ncbi:MAG: hypothetical protein QM644_18490 [Mobilitalea sp.]
MTDMELKIISKAAKIRVDKGEDSHDVLNSYGKLTDEEKYRILKEIKEGQIGR